MICAISGSYENIGWMAGASLQGSAAVRRTETIRTNQGTLPARGSRAYVRYGGSACGYVGCHSRLKLFRARLSAHRGLVAMLPPNRTCSQRLTDRQYRTSRRKKGSCKLPVCLEKGSHPSCPRKSDWRGSLLRNKKY